jgi:flagellar hook-length control protein FliK
MQQLASSAAQPAAAAGAKAAADTALALTGTTDKHASGGTEPSATAGTSVDGAAAVAQMSAGAAGVPDSPATPTLKVTAGVETADFGQGLAERVSWMVDRNLNGAKLQVNPPQLGPIEVRIAVQGDHAQVWLTSHSAVTRDALESSSPKLREMLGSQGFGQVSVDISQRSFQERPAFSQPYAAGSAAARAAVTAVSAPGAGVMPRAASGMLDAYA